MRYESGFTACGGNRGLALENVSQKQHVLSKTFIVLIRLSQECSNVGVVLPGYVVTIDVLMS